MYLHLLDNGTLQVECYIPKPRQELLNYSTNIFKSENATDFEVQISDKGADLFYKENYPSMELVKCNGQYKIKGFYNVGEERFIADYFLSYGKLINSIYPEQLKTLVLERTIKIRRTIMMFVRLINLSYNRPVAVLM